MTGSYPDVPGPRMAYDRDGTAVVSHDGVSALTILSNAEVAALNNELSDTVYALPAGDTFICFVFPQLRDLRGWGAGFGGAGTYTPQYSANTTNGIDGTWTNLASAISNTAFGPAGPLHRTAISAVTHNGIIAVRFSIAGLGGDRNVYGVHLYGSIASGATPDRLVFQDRLGNPLTGAFFDWGDVPQGSSADKLFAVKNISSTKTATSTTVSVEALTDTTPSVASEHLLSTDDTNFFASVTIATLAPGQTQNLAIRRVTPADAVLSVWDARVVASAVTFA